MWLGCRQHKRRTLSNQEPRLDPTNKSRQLSIIRNLDAGQFGYLVCILFDNEFGVKEAYKIPHGAIAKYAQFSKHQNGHILHLRGAI